jgi:hypothetical protein
MRAEPRQPAPPLFVFQSAAPPAAHDLLSDLGELGLERFDFLVPLGEKALDRFVALAKRSRDLGEFHFQLPFLKRCADALSAATICFGGAGERRPAACGELLRRGLRELELIVQNVLELAPASDHALDPRDARAWRDTARR